jgi:hypothetical protein
MAMLSMRRTHSPWHVAVESVSGKTRIVNDFNEVICEMTKGHEDEAKLIAWYHGQYSPRED